MLGASEASGSGNRFYLCCLKVDENVVIVMNRVCVCLRLAPSPLEVLPANKTPVNVDVGQGNGTDFLKVKIQHRSVDL